MAWISCRSTLVALLGADGSSTLSLTPTFRGNTEWFFTFLTV
jgi:hypothetical protein